MAADTAKKKSAPRGSKVFSDEELEILQEVRSERRRAAKGKLDGRAEVLAKIAAMPEEDRVLAERIHEIVTATAPELEPRTWYGMPAYAKDGQVLCFFQDAAKFKARYATFGFSDKAKLDEGSMWPASYALTSLSKADEERIAALVRKAVG
ncbi:MAG TPA: DUF1801 domain-containing protein [Alphaproteobacteria bacterium]|nr:DUF1801 domain-containing protein [Alphaproteobacteria bacterium]